MDGSGPKGTVGCNMMVLEKIIKILFFIGLCAPATIGAQTRDDSSLRPGASPASESNVRPGATFDLTWKIHHGPRPW